MSQVKTFARNSQNKLILNPLKLDAQWFTLVPDATPTIALPAPVVVASGVTSGPIVFTVGQDGPFEGAYLTCHRRATVGFAESFQNTLVDIYDEGAKRNLMNQPIHIDCLFGKTIAAPAGTVGIGPHLLAESLYLNPQRTLTMRFNNNGGGVGVSLDYWPAIHGTRYYSYANPSRELAVAVEKRAARARVSSPFWLTTDMGIAAQPAASLANYQTTVTADGHFEWWKTTYVADQDFLLSFIDRRNGRSMSNNPIYCRAGMGTASFPFILPEHTLLQANSQLQLVVQNLAAAATLTAYITLCGRRIYVA